jgi:hypothetical protein
LNVSFNTLLSITNDRIIAANLTPRFERALFAACDIYPGRMAFDLRHYFKLKKSLRPRKTLKIQGGMQAFIVT